MSLNFDYRNVKGPRTHPANLEEIHPVLNSLIWLTLGIGMGTITEENAQEFAWRVSLYERIEGAMCRIPGAPVFITLEDVRQYIGLRTNVSYVKEAQFLKDMWARVKDKMPNGSAVDIFDEHVKKVKQTPGA